MTLPSIHTIDHPFIIHLERYELWEGERGYVWLLSHLTTYILTWSLELTSAPFASNMDTISLWPFSDAIYKADFPSYETIIKIWYEYISYYQTNHQTWTNTNHTIYGKGLTIALVNNIKILLIVFFNDYHNRFIGKIFIYSTKICVNAWQVS